MVGMIGAVCVERRAAVRKRQTRAGHERTRRDHSTETAEDYVEAVADVIDDRGECRVRDLAARFGVSHVTVVRVVGRLEKEGYVVTQAYRPLELTDKGRRLARKCRARHEVVYRFLRAIGVSERVAAIDAEGIEHHVSDQTLARFREIADSRGG